MKKLEHATDQIAIDQFHRGIEAGACDLVLPLLRRIVGHPDALTVGADAGGSMLAVSAIPHPEDVRSLVGSKGAMFHSVKVLVTAYALRHGMQAHYSIHEDREFRKAKHEPPFVGRDDWPRGEIEDLLTAACRALFSHPCDPIWDHEPTASRAFLRLDASEPVRLPDAALLDALSRVFNAIGKGCGRTIFVEELRRNR